MEDREAWIADQKLRGAVDAIAFAVGTLLLENGREGVMRALREIETSKRKANASAPYLRAFAYAAEEMDRGAEFLARCSRAAGPDDP